MLDRLLTYDDVAKAWGVSHKTVRRMAARGDLTKIRIGGQVRFRQADVDAYIAARVEQARPPRTREGVGVA